MADALESVETFRNAIGAVAGGVYGKVAERRQGKDGKGKDGKGKDGKGPKGKGGKGNGKGDPAMNGLQLTWKTPDGRDKGFVWNSQASGARESATECTAAESKGAMQIIQPSSAKT